MSDTNLTSQYYLTLNILTFAMMAGVVLFALVAVYLVNRDGGLNPDMVSLMPVAFLMAVAAVPAGEFLFKRQVATIRPDQPLYLRLNTFRGAHIIRLALSEGPALLAVVLYLLSGSLYLLVLAFALVAWMAMNRPSVQKLSEALHLTKQEKDEIFG